MVRFIDYPKGVLVIILGNGENFIINIFALLKFSYYLYFHIENLNINIMPIINFNHANKKNTVTKKNNGYGEIRKRANVPYGTFSIYGNEKAVYGIKSKITGKVYIGSTKHIQRRLMKHFNELFHNRHSTKVLQEEFNKYGFNSFDIIIYDSNVNTNLLEKEKEIQISIGIDNLYNEKISGYWVKEEYRNKLANSSKTTHKTKEYRQKMSKLKTNKVGQYHFSGTLIKIWDSAIQICETLGYTRSVILSCCNGNKSHAYGFDWRYVDDNGNIVKNGYDKARKQ